MSKLPDIIADTTLMSASVLCFCETWLNTAQTSPVLVNNQIDIRCDTLSCEKKGGVLMCIPSQYSQNNVQRFACHGIEAVSATVRLPYIGIIQLALIYRSPDVPITTLIMTLTNLLQHVSLCNTPCLILGDFNENVLKLKNSPLLTLMSDFNFVQLVHKPTTPQGTLLDHVYYRNPCMSYPMIHVQDTLL